MKVTPQLETWRVALQSGDYKQGKVFLRNGDYWCCLGVLANVVDPEGWQSPDEYRVGDHLAHLGEENFPAPRVCEAVGMSTPEAQFLAMLNDGGMEFPQIAATIDWLTKTPPTARTLVHYLRCLPDFYEDSIPVDLLKEITMFSWPTFQENKSGQQE